eukprot:CAMPEP_0204113056 /NCGR_PEP_ID=MMETSP0361-20130328/3431_1 /ASSEMBLY_ACC=CAM_ASM_000343 /TAXON_ID=268821 /ORGANISM="Scrippsiella Hangoei, Strain SHTV-5" /LENGTH=403 /DNA_ID=CAMNT_0051063359 /DNA_START=26 /DNA_END=1233 /DNA_ORIENTATION=+
MRVSHGVLMGVLLLYTLPWSGQRVEAYYSWTEKVAILCRMFLGLMHLEISVSIWTNVAFGLSCASCFRRVDPSRQSQFLANQFVQVVALIVILLAFEANLISNARREVKERSTQGQRSAVASLLSTVCDAVLELDDELRMVGDSLALSNALFHGQARGLLGKPLKQLVVGDDQLFFEEKMASQDESSTDVANMFHVRLCDSWGNSVPMELFHVPFRGMGGEMRHLVGLREHGDAPAKVPETGHSLDESFASAPCGQTPRPVNISASAGRGVRLHLDVLAVEPMKVMSASPKFIKKCGPVGTFEELLPNPQEFRQWLIGNADAVWSGRQSTQACDFGGLVVAQAAQSAVAFGEGAVSEPPGAGAKPDRGKRPVDVQGEHHVGRLPLWRLSQQQYQQQEPRDIAK